MTTFRPDAPQPAVTPATSSKGFLVRTNLRASLAWDDLDDKAKALWSQLTNTVSNATTALTGSGDSSKSAK
jgi:hypothetical protein